MKVLKWFTLMAVVGLVAAVAAVASSREQATA